MIFVTFSYNKRSMIIIVRGRNNLRLFRVYVKFIYLQYTRVKKKNMIEPLYISPPAPPPRPPSV